MSGSEVWLRIPDPTIQVLTSDYSLPCRLIFCAWAETDYRPPLCNPWRQIMSLKVTLIRGHLLPERGVFKLQISTTVIFLSMTCLVHDVDKQFRPVVFQRVVPGAAASASPGSVWEMQPSRPQPPTPPESHVLCRALHTRPCENYCSTPFLRNVNALVWRKAFKDSGFLPDVLPHTCTPTEALLQWRDYIIGAPSEPGTDLTTMYVLTHTILPGPLYG